MIKKIIWTVFLCIIAGILQSSVLPKITFLKAIPDLSLCVLVYSAYVNGTMTGQVSGFLSGILLDFLSSVPLGLNCLVRTLIGALAGVFKGSFFLDIFFMPVILCALATLLKAVIVLLIHLIIGPAVQTYSPVSSKIWIELGLNCLCAPLLFLLLKRFKSLLPERS
jgi:rod shape-determining protein MreD